MCVLWPRRTKATGELCGSSASVRLHRTELMFPLPSRSSYCDQGRGAGRDRSQLIQPPAKAEMITEAQGGK